MITFYRCITLVVFDYSIREVVTIIRTCRAFPGVSAISKLYSSLVRSKLESVSLVYSPRARKHLDRLKRVHRKFLRFLVFKKSGSRIGHILHPVEPQPVLRSVTRLTLSLGLESLTQCSRN